MFKYRKAIYTIFIILAIISSLIILKDRIIIEKNSNSVEIVFDYQSLSNLCVQENIPIEIALKHLKEAGVTSIAFSETTAEQLQSQGRINWMTGPQLIGMMKMAGLPASKSLKTIKPGAIYLMDYSPLLGKTLKKNLKLLSNDGSFKEKNIQINETESIETIEISGKIREIPTMGLGFDWELIEKVKDSGFYIVLRPENRAWLNKEKIEHYMLNMDLIPGATTVIFGGVNETLGYPFKLDIVAESFLKTKLAFGDIEVPNKKAKQKGAQFLALKLLDRTVRVQSISKQYLAKLTPDRAVDMFRLGVRERNIRLLYLRPFPAGFDEKTAFETNIDFVSKLKAELERYGFTTGPASRLPIVNPGPVMLVLITLGAIGVFLLLLDYFYVDNGLVGMVLLLGGLLFSIALITTGKVHILQKVIGLFIGICFPVYAFSSRFEEMEMLETHDNFFKMTAYAIGTFAKITLVTLGGGLMIAALFTSTSFMLAVDQFRGVKLVLFLPPALIVLFYYLLGTKAR